MNKEEQANVGKQLQIIAGNLKIAIAMVENGENFDQVLYQLIAVRGALNTVARIMLREHLAECESIIKHSSLPQERAQALDHLTMLYHWTFNEKLFE